MAKRIFQATTWTPTATADTATLANATYMAIGAGTATQLLNVIEIYMGGQAGASSPTIMVFGRDSTVGATPTALAGPNTDGPMSPATAALATVALTFVAASTGPQRSAVTTSTKLNLSFNAFGGIVRWVAAPGEEWGILSTTQPLGESSLSAYTGGTPGLLGSHVVYEPF